MCSWKSASQGDTSDLPLMQIPLQLLIIMLLASIFLESFIVINNRDDGCLRIYRRKRSLIFQLEIDVFSAVIQFFWLPR